MTRRELAAHLLAAGIEEAEEEAKLLFCHVTGMSRAALLAEPGADCTDPALFVMLQRRCAREPLAYLLGEVHFFRECYHVSPDCLIPRPETELLVEYGIEALPQGGRLADLCTGSGCIAISLLANRPDATGDGYDISAAALRLANENAKRHGIGARLRLFCTDLLQRDGLFGDYDLILSNPPYVTPKEWAKVAPELHYEPQIAFLGGADGLDFYRHFIQAFAGNLRPGGRFVFEIGWQQADALRAGAAEAGFGCEIYKDLGGRDRMAVFSKL